tara:strand:+ start:2651 stop:3244 length:594 start_codon:yes stop_codon:yes gene_type:complete
MFNFSKEVLDIWAKGGWLMLPLFVLTLFIYYAVLELFLRLSGHFLVRSGYHSSSDEAIALALRSGHQGLSRVIAFDVEGPVGARRHFKEVRAEYLPVIDRRIHFLSILVATGPLLGLLGTVTGMLTTFDGIAAGESSKFGIIISGVSEALITTQGGLIISIPAFVLLSFIIHKRNRLERCLSRLEQYNVRIAMRRDD